MNISDYLYYRLPKVYQSEDKEQLLKRFIDTFAEAGFNPLLEETLSITDLLDVDKCPSRFLPQLCKMYGYEYTLEIPELFQRRLLKHIVEMYKRKGTKSVVKFIARELTGFDSEIIENKDFTEEHIRLTKWDIRFEHYRNFVLKLTAPYENSNLFNKEEIVIKIVNDFLPTNSQVFVITAYWFKEETEIVKKAVEEISDLVKDYNNEITSIQEKALFSDTLKTTLGVEDFYHTIMAEEESYLNPPVEIGMNLFTNALLKIQDTVRYNLEEYSKFINPVENETSEKSYMIEEETLQGLSNYDENTEVKHRTTKIEGEDTSSLVAQSIFSIYNMVRPNVDYEETTVVTSTEEYDRKFNLTFTPEVEILPEGRINTNSCDIINNVEEETFNYTLKSLSQETTLLNLSTVLMTNAIHSYDIVRETGKPDKIILI